jgi:predicted dithiol-disulfide oxidoreductase (DUF899 family)
VIEPEHPRSPVRLPGESPAYRAARDRLLGAELELRRATEAAAAARRALPPGGLVPEDYRFEMVGEDGGVAPMRFSELFAPGKDTLVVYHFMYSPDMEEACPACTSILDALDGNARDLMQRVNLAVVATSPLPRILAHAQTRGWRHLRLLSTAGSTFARDYLSETAEGEQQHMVNVFVRREGELRHFWASEIRFQPDDDGQHNRCADFMWPLWNVLDVTPDGRGEDPDFPSLSYD